MRPASSSAKIGPPRLSSRRPTVRKDPPRNAARGSSRRAGGVSPPRPRLSATCRTLWPRNGLVKDWRRASVPPLVPSSVRGETTRTTPTTTSTSAPRTRPWSTPSWRSCNTCARRLGCSSPRPSGGWSLNLQIPARRPSASVSSPQMDASSAARARLSRCSPTPGSPTANWTRAPSAWASPRPSQPSARPRATWPARRFAWASPRAPPPGSTCTRAERTTRSPPTCPSTSTSWSARTTR